MSIYEALGYVVVIYLSLVGIVTHGKLIIAGLRRTAAAIDVGQLHTDSAVREYLERISR